MKLKDVLSLKKELSDPKALLKHRLQQMIDASDGTLYLIERSASTTRRTVYVDVLLIGCLNNKPVLTNITKEISSLLEKPLVKNALRIQSAIPDLMVGLDLCREVSLRLFDTIEDPRLNNHRWL